MLAHRLLLLAAALAMVLDRSTDQFLQAAEAARPPGDPPWPPPLRRRSLLAQPAGPGPGVSKPTGAYFNMGTINVQDIWCVHAAVLQGAPAFVRATCPPLKPVPLLQLRLCPSMGPLSRLSSPPRLQGGPQERQ